MPVDIKDYKKTILDMFQSLTETEVNVVKDVIRSDPEKNSDLGMIYLMAINRCRQLLEVILKGTVNENS